MFGVETPPEGSAVGLLASSSSAVSWICVDKTAAKIKEETRGRNVRKARDLVERERAEMIRPRLHTQKLNILTLTRSVTTFQHMGFLCSAQERTVGTQHPVCANSHVALVCVDPVKQSLRGHPFHGQTTLQQQNHKDQRDRDGETQHRLF